MVPSQNVTKMQAALSNEKNRSRSRYMTVLSVLSCFAVIVLHVNGCFWTFSREPYWLSANALECLAYFAVPVFFMISGANLMDFRERYGVKVYAKKRFFRTVVPFLFWSCIGLVWSVVVNHQPVGSPFEVIANILNAGYVNVYWFFPFLFAVYLAIPFISYIPKNVRKEAFGYGILVAVLTASVLPLVFQLCGTGYNTGLNMPAVTSYLVYALIGYWVNHYEIPKKWRVIIYLAGAAGFAAHFFGTWYMSWQAGSVVQMWKGYIRIPGLIYSVAVFVFFRYHNDSGWMRQLERPSKALAGTTLGIYLIHWFVLKIVEHYLPFSNTDLLYRIFGSIVIFLICAAIIWVMKKIPLVKKIVP